MRRMLDPTKVGGLPSTIGFDKDGNREVKKNLGIAGKLTLKSLVSASNPDGDITKELGGGGGGESIQLYHHHIYLYYSDDFNNKGYTNAKEFTIDTLITAMKGKAVICSGYMIITLKRIVASITSIDNQLQVKLFEVEGTAPNNLMNYTLNKDNITIQDQVYLIN